MQIQNQIESRLDSQKNINPLIRVESPLMDPINTDFKNSPLCTPINLLKLGKQDRQEIKLVRANIETIRTTSKIELAKLDWAAEERYRKSLPALVEEISKTPFSRSTLHFLAGEFNRAFAMLDTISNLGNPGYKAVTNQITPSARMNNIEFDKRRIEKARNKIQSNLGGPARNPSRI
jgi:hypothetical protein